MEKFKYMTMEGEMIREKLTYSGGNRYKNTERYTKSLGNMQPQHVLINKDEKLERICWLDHTRERSQCFLSNLSMFLLRFC